MCHTECSQCPAVTKTNGSCDVGKCKDVKEKH